MGQLIQTVLSLLRVYCAAAATAPLVRTPWETPQIRDSPAQYAVDADELVSTVADAVRSCPEYERFRDLVLESPALRQFSRLESEQYLTFDQQVFHCATSVARHYFHKIRFRVTPEFIEEEATTTAQLLESELRSGEVDTVALALLGGMVTDGVYEIEHDVSIRPPTTFEFESFYNGWSIHAVPNLLTRIQVLQSHALLEIKKRMPRDEADLAAGPHFTNYVLAVNLGVDDCYIIEKRFIVDSVITGRVHESETPKQKVILHSALIEGEGVERIRDYLNLVRSSTNVRRISVAISRLTDGIIRTELSDAVVDHMVGIESIVTSNERGEINFKVALRLAALVGFDRDDALFLLKDVKRLYGVRSRILHGDEVVTLEADARSVRWLLTRAIVGVLRMDYDFEPGLIDRGLLKSLHTKRSENTSESIEQDADADP